MAIRITYTILFAILVTVLWLIITSQLQTSQSITLLQVNIGKYINFYYNDPHEQEDVNRRIDGNIRHMYYEQVQSHPERTFEAHFYNLRRRLRSEMPNIEVTRRLNLLRRELESTRLPAEPEQQMGYKTKMLIGGATTVTFATVCWVVGGWTVGGPIAFAFALAVGGVASARAVVFNRQSNGG